MDKLLYFLGGILAAIAVQCIISDGSNSDKLNQIILKLNQMALSQSQLAAELTAIKDQNEKARTEILAKIAALEEALANAGNTTPEVDAALADLKASVQTDDDLNPDA